MRSPAAPRRLTSSCGRAATKKSFGIDARPTGYCLAASACSHAGWSEQVSTVRSGLRQQRTGLGSPYQDQSFVTGAESGGHGSTNRGLAVGSQIERVARRHTRAVGRRVREDADRRRERRSRTSSLRLHHVARRRRGGGNLHTGPPTNMAGTPSKTRSTSTTCTRRSRT